MKQASWKYYARRSAEHVALARSAPSLEVRTIHLRLSAAYDRLARQRRGRLTRQTRFVIAPALLGRASDIPSSEMS